MFAAVIFTAISIGRAGSLVPDSSKSKRAIGRILSQLERIPPIDVTSTEGIIPVKKIKK